MNAKERLKEIEEWPGYLISRDGLIYSTKRRKFIKSYLNRAGYSMVHLRNPGTSKCILLSRSNLMRRLFESSTDKYQFMPYLIAIGLALALTIYVVLK